MAQQNHLYVVVPVLNEEQNLFGVMDSFSALRSKFGAASQHPFDVSFILVDDGSADRTVEMATRLAGEKNVPLEILCHKTNLGPGRAFGTAFASLHRCLKADDWVLTMEGDNTSRHELVDQMLTRTREGYDVILASPYMYTGGIVNTTTFRVILSRIANIFVKEFYGLNGIITVSSFFRLYRGSVLQRLQCCYGEQVIERSGFECMIEILLKMMYLGVAISEVPMVLDTSLRKGRSKMKILRTIWGYLSLSRDIGKWKNMARRCNLEKEP
ncbi:MAG: glycosyltransferase family 2 protein [Anaerolineae bacterium]|nr:glycosyltransferase family 2 protein [Anaerolineae bacterium]